MPTFDFKSDCGAFGNTQSATRPVSITSGTKNLSATTNTWTAGDVGKNISVPGSVASTIAVFVDQQHVTLTDNAVATLTNASKLVTWGNDDAPAAIAFRAANPGGIGVQLNVSAGTYGFFTSGGTYIVKGLKQVIVIGAGNPVFCDGGGAGGFFTGGICTFFDNAHSARTETVSAGATSIVLKDASKASLFVPGRYARMTGLCLQNFGDPANHHFFEDILITGVSGSVVSFSAPLVNSYKSTWPLYYAGDALHSDLGGPATLYALDPSYDIDVDYRGITFGPTTGQIVGRGRSVKYSNNCIFVSTSGAIPTECNSWTMQDCDASGFNDPNGWEPDKGVKSMTVSNTTIAGNINFQSSSVDLCTMSNVHVTAAVIGLPRRFVGTGLTIDTGLRPGPIAYGVAKSASISNSTMPLVDIGGVLDVDIVADGCTMSAGVIAVPNANGPPPWGIPGAASFFVGSQEGEVLFNVTDVTQDAAYTYVHTDLSGGFPAISGTLAIRTHPCKNLTFSTSSGCADVVDFSGAAAGRPIYSYSNRSYNGATAADRFYIWGNIVSIKVNVTKAYTGVQSTLTHGFSEFDNLQVRLPDYSTVTYAPRFDLKAVGERIITVGSTSGAKPGDSGINISQQAWFIGTILPSFSADISGESSAVWPAYTVEIITDHGIAEDEPEVATRTSAPDPFTAEDLADLRHHQDELKKATQRRSKNKREVQAKLRDAVEEVYDKLSGIAPAAAAKVAAVIPAKAKITETAASSNDETPAIDWSKVTTTQIAKVIATMDAYVAQIAAEQRQQAIARADAARQQDEDDVESLLMSTP